MNAQSSNRGGRRAAQSKSEAPQASDSTGDKSSPEVPRDTANDDGAEGVASAAEAREQRQGGSDVPASGALQPPADPAKDDKSGDPEEPSEVGALNRTEEPDPVQEQRREAHERNIHRSAFQDGDGNPLTYDEMFQDDNGTFVTTKTRIYEEFTYPNTTAVGKRLAYAAGRRVARGEAENVRALLESEGD